MKHVGVPFTPLRTPPMKSVSWSWCRLLCGKPRSWAERAYHKLIHYHKLAEGGHFADWEQPKLLVDELREGLESLR